ncbi:pectinesterase precursor [Colletotrichum asianum]
MPSTPSPASPSRPTSTSTATACPAQTDIPFLPSSSPSGPASSINSPPSHPNSNSPTATGTRARRNRNTAKDAHFLRQASEWLIERYILVPPIPWGIPLTTISQTSSHHTNDSHQTSSAHPEHHHLEQDDTTRTRAERPTLSVMATDPDRNAIAAPSGSHSHESDRLTDSDPSTAGTASQHSAATSTTAQTTAVPSSSSSSSSTSLSVSVGASIGNFPSSSAPCPTCGQRRHVDLHRPPTPVKPEDRFQFRSGVPYGPWTITHPPRTPAPQAVCSEPSEVPAPATKVECAAEPAPGPLTAFHPFSRLPPELRSKILRFYLERPRIVEIRCMNDLKKIHFAPNALGNLASNIAWSADNTLPALMWVNRECRAETRAFYRVQLPMHPTNKIAWPVIINPEYDTVIFTFPWSSEIPLDIFLSDCLAFDPLRVGIRHFGTRDRGGPETWDLTPVPGCAPLSKSLANLESYTEAIQLMDDRAAARFPVWMIHEGYLTSGIPAKDAFYHDVPRLLLSNDYEPPDAANQRNALEALRTQLGDYLPDKVAEKLVMQRMFYRKYFRHLRMKCTKTDLAGLGMVRQIPGGETEEFFLSNGREVAGPRKKRRSALEVRPSSSWHLWDED